LRHVFSAEFNACVSRSIIMQGRDDVEAMLRAGMLDKHERWEEVERSELLHLISTQHTVGAF
jgi:hypothetical protein